MKMKLMMTINHHLPMRTINTYFNQTTQWLEENIGWRKLRKLKRYIDEVGLEASI